MRKLVITTIVALAVLLIATSAASAAAVEQYRFEPGGEITKTSLGNITFSAGELDVECNLMLAGILENEWIPAGEGGEWIGQINEVGWEGCNGGTIGEVLELPWEMNMWRLLETNANDRLPNQANVEALTGFLKTFHMKILLSLFGGFVNCLYSGEIRTLSALTQTRTRGVYVVGRLVILQGTTLALVPERSHPSCPGATEVIGTFHTEPAQRFIAM